MDNLYDRLVMENIELNKEISSMKSTFTALKALLEMIQTTESSSTVKDISQNCLDLINQH